MNGKAPDITKEQITAFKRQRVEACQTAIQAVLDEYDCKLVAMPEFTADGRVAVVMQIMSK